MPVNDEFRRALLDEMSVLTSGSIDRLWERAKAEFFAEWEMLSRQGLDDKAIARSLDVFMHELSLAPVDRVARSGSTVAYSQGRNASTLTAKEDDVARFVVRSEVLDTNTCRPCSILDSEIFAIDSSEYFANMPPAQCDGGGACRGFYIAIGSEG